MGVVKNHTATTPVKVKEMKTQYILLFLVQFIACCVITWRAESTLFAVLAYVLLIVVLSGIVKNLINH